MLSRDKKLTAVFNFGVMVGQNPWFAFLIGYLAGQIDRVWFLRDLTGADIAVRISVRTTAIWPHEPFKAKVRGVSMPNTYTLVRSIADDDTPICVSLDFDHAEDTPWYQEVLLPNVSYVTDPETAAKEESDALWSHMDRTLDIYRECKALVQASPERKQELSYYIRLAEEQMKKLSDEMERLNRHIRQLSGEEDEVT